MDFPSSTVTKTAYTAEGTGSIPGQGTKILHTAWCGQNKVLHLEEPNHQSHNNYFGNMSLLQWLIISNL